jgi:hypothetical protein
MSWLFALALHTRISMAAIEKGKDVCISGRLYRLLVPVFRQRWTQGLLKLLGVGI